MKIQVLASVMNQSAEEILEKMNIDSDAIFINQCDRYEYKELEYKGHKIFFYSCAEKGVGRSRNQAILKADEDICLFSDEDIVYEKGYEKAVLNEFKKNPIADMIVFNIQVEESRRTYFIEKYKRVRWYNSGRYGAVSFAIRTDKLLESGVMFSLMFGGGAKYCGGEDSLFLSEFIKKGYKVFAAPVMIGREEAEGSSWFEGYNEKYFYDRGALYQYLYGKAAVFMSLRFLISHRNVMCTEIGLFSALKIMLRGVKRR